MSKYAAVIRGADRLSVDLCLQSFDRMGFLPVKNSTLEVFISFLVDPSFDIVANIEDEAGMLKSRLCLVLIQ